MSQPGVKGEEWADGSLRWKLQGECSMVPLVVPREESKFGLLKGEEVKRTGSIRGVGSWWFRKGGGKEEWW